jgi:hypothetical protein
MESRPALGNFDREAKNMVDRGVVRAENGSQIGILQDMQGVREGGLHGVHRAGYRRRAPSRQQAAKIRETAERQPMSHSGPVRIKAATGPEPTPGASRKAGMDIAHIKTGSNGPVGSHLLSPSSMTAL